MAADILNQILERKRQEVDSARQAIPESRLVEQAHKRKDHRPFLETLSTPGPFGVNIIAEVKRGSPSRGLMRPDLDAAVCAKTYERGGAAAISVLTDQSFFYGSMEDLKRAREATGLPVLRKDFIISTYQIYEAAAHGADAVLLIAGALSADFLRDCISLCSQLKLDALVEIHTFEELEKAVLAGANLIGVNNRDLRTFETDIGTSIDLAPSFKPGHVAVSESGIRDRSDVERLLEAGIFNFLIGESLVKAADPEDLLGHLLGEARIAAK